VGLGDHPDDRQAEPCARPFPAGLWAAEALEGVPQKGGWKSATLVLDVELDGSVDIARAQAHAPVAVAERIVDKVAESLFEAKAVAVERHSGRSVVGERPRALIRAPLEPAYHG
jgi:hypothetical protein